MAEPEQTPEIHYWNEAVVHVNFWWDAVQMQRERVLRDVQADTELPTRRLADALLLLVALHRLTRAVSFAAARFPAGTPQHARIAELLAVFRAAHPEASQLRHATEHFDKWLLGKGIGQKATNKASPFAAMESTGGKR